MNRVEIGLFCVQGCVSLILTSTGIELNVFQVISVSTNPISFGLISIGGDAISRSKSKLDGGIAVIVLMVFRVPHRIVRVLVDISSPSLMVLSDPGVFSNHPMRASGESVNVTSTSSCMKREYSFAQYQSSMVGWVSSKSMLGFLLFRSNLFCLTLSRWIQNVTPFSAEYSTDWMLSIRTVFCDPPSE